MRSERRAAALAAVMALAASLAPAELVERVVAVVDGRALCLSDVRAVEELDGVGRDVALGRLVDETLLFHEAFRLPQAALAENDGADGDAAVRRARQRRAVIRRYVDFRFRPQVRIEDEAVRQAYAVGSVADPAGADFDRAAPALRERLVSAEVARRVEEWLRDLRAAARIRYNPD
jgi:hypothetical protein